YRRIKAYKNYPIARWLDILENTTGSSIKVQVSIYTNVRYSVTRRKTSSGGQNFGPKDWAIWTKGSSSRGYPTLHVVTTPGAKVRPTLSVSSSQIYTRYNLTIPAGKTVVLCHFESQNSNTTNLDKLMNKFPTKELFKDLPGSVRRMIVNMKAGGGVDGVELSREDKSDRVMLSNGDLMLGTVGNKSFKLSTLLGDMELPASELLGMVVGKKGQLRFVMTNGQVVGASAVKVKLALSLPSGGKLDIPMDKIKQWSYRISKEKPDDLGQLGPYIALNTGDILAVDAGSDAMKLGLRTKYGLIDLKPAELLEIRRNQQKGAKEPYVAAFINGSKISGRFVGASLSLPLKLTRRKVDVPKDKLELMFFSEEDKPLSRPDSMLLDNGDKLLGQLVDKAYTLSTDFGKAEISTDKMKKISFSRPKPDAKYLAVIEMLNGTILRGGIDKEMVAFSVGSAIRLSVPIEMVTSVTRPNPVEHPNKGPGDPEKPPLIPGIGPPRLPRPIIQPRLIQQLGGIDRD
ncbi:MAG: hypothetical protein QGH94_03985, partial [Phycisphaerae bacterium]|nr:hypothetical protein [Phycisphaerae bacterium]